MKIHGKIYKILDLPNQNVIYFKYLPIALSPSLDLSSFELISHVQLSGTPWTAAYQAPLSMGFSRQEHCSGLPFPSPGDLPDPRIKPESPALQADT